MNLLKLIPEKIDANSFVEFWKDYYGNFNEQLYEEVLAKPLLEAEDIRKLYSFKNNMGGSLSLTKEVFVSYVISELETVNSLKKTFDWKLFHEKFANRGPVWSITLLHAINPHEFPIYDQHAFRAFAFIQTGKVPSEEEIPKRYQVYNAYKGYQSFFSDFKQVATEYSAREIDKALWSFGKFLSQYRKMAYVNDKH